jgi:hypothetical protein
MAGYAILSPALAAGPPGWVVWAVAGTAITIGAIWAADEVLVYERTKTEPRSRTKTDPIPITDCNNKKRYGARVHAQGSDCGGTTRSTIGVPGISRFGAPITVAEGLALSAGTWALLNKTQKEVRTTAKVQADNYISNSPGVGGRLGMKSFLSEDRRGGKRYDVDTFGDGPSFNF